MTQYNYKIYGNWEATPDTLVPIHAREYYYDEHGYLIQEWIVAEWCRENQIRARRHNTGTYMQDLWSVPDPKQRLIFMLRWS